MNGKCLLIGAIAGFIGSTLSAPPRATGADRWTLATDDTVLTIGQDDQAGVVLRELKNTANGFNWIPKPCPIPLMNRVGCDGNDIVPDWTLQDVAIDTSEGTKLALRFTSTSPKLEMRSQWWARPGKGPIHQSAYITNNSNTPVTITNQPTLLLQLQAPPTSPLYAWHFATDGGHQAMDPQGAYREQVTQGFNRTLRTDPTAPNGKIPLVVLNSGGHQGLYVGTEWSYGDIQITGSSGNPQGVLVQSGNVLDFQTTLEAGQMFEVPPGFVGAYQGDIDNAGNDLRKHLLRYNMPAVLRNDAAYPKVQWNAFAATGKTLGSWDSVESKYYPFVRDIAPLGFEEAMLDVGWWSGGEPNADPQDWPSGMKAAADYAHQRNLRFGIYWSDNADMTTAPGRTTRANRIKRLYAEHCGDIWRSDETGGKVVTADYWSVKGFYEMLDGLQQDVPGFQWENCHGGGRIKDYGAMKRSVKVYNSDNWSELDVRKVFYDSSFAFHPIQLESQLGITQMGSDGAYNNDYRPVGVAGMKYAFRSSSMGAATWAIDVPNGGNGHAPWTEEEKQAVRSCVATYKEKIRPLVRNADLYHILPRPDNIVWDGIEYYDPATSKGVVFLFKADSPHDTQTVKLKGLDASLTYRLTFEDGSNPPVDKPAAELLGTGINVTLSGKFISEWMFFEAANPSVPPAADQTSETNKPRDTDSPRKATEYWYDYENIFDDVLKSKDSVASAAPMPVKVDDLEFRKVYETPVGPKWSSWAQAYIAESGVLNVVFKVIEGGPADLAADYKWQYIGPKALNESGVKRTYRHLESTDHGRTWRDVAVYDASDLSTPIVLPALSLGKGSLLGVGGIWDGWDHARNSYDLVGTLMTAISHDNGKTWENRQTLNDPATKDRLVWCHPKLLHDGPIVLPAYGTNTKIGSLPNGATEPASFDAHLFFSNDEGKSWSKQLLIAKGTPTLSMEEPAVAELGNGDLLVILRHTNPSKAGSNDVYVTCGQIIVRKVEGKWVAGPLMRTHLGFRGMPALLRTRDGVLICAGSGNQFNFSIDDGKTWSATQVIADPAYNRHNHYPVMVELSDGRVMSLYHLGNDLPYPPPEPEWIHSTSFKLSRP